MVPAEEARFAMELILVILFGIIMTGGIMVWLMRRGRIK